MAQSELKFDAPFEEKVSRLFIFRVLYFFVEFWILLGWALWAAFAMWLHTLYMLVLGKRHRMLWDTHMRFLRHTEKWNAYVSGLTDKRPDWISE